jgi:hypothetical protein
VTGEALSDAAKADEIYRALGRYMVCFSHLVHAMEEGIRRFAGARAPGRR